MDLGTKRPGLLGGPVEQTTHRPRFGASPSLLCSSVTKKRTKCHEAGCFFWVPDLPETTEGMAKHDARLIGRVRSTGNLSTG